MRITNKPDLVAMLACKNISLLTNNIQIKLSNISIYLFSWLDFTGCWPFRYFIRKKFFTLFVFWSILWLHELLLYHYWWYFCWQFNNRHWCMDKVEVSIPIVGLFIEVWACISHCEVLLYEFISLVKDLCFFVCVCVGDDSAITIFLFQIVLLCSLCDRISSSTGDIFVFHQTLSLYLVSRINIFVLIWYGI